MSFNNVGSLTAARDTWEFVGLKNYVELFQSKIFLRSIVNVAKIWLVEGAVVLGFATLFSVILTSGVKGKSFWRSMLYLPNVISAVAMATMWLQYVFNSRYGLLRTVFEALGMEKMARYQWTSPDNLFLSMMIAVAFGSIGYYVLIIVAGIDNIPIDYYEAATIEGAGIVAKFFYITMPLLKDIYKRCIIFWSAGALGFFVWSSLFSFNMEPSTVTPVVYMYERIFGKATVSAGSSLNVGLGASVGVVVMIAVLIVNAIISRLLKTEEEN